MSSSSFWYFLVALRNKWHRCELPSEEHGVSQRDMLANRCPVWASGPGAAEPAVTLSPCSTTTITPLQTLCQDTVVTQPWASVPPLSTRLMDTERTRGEKIRSGRLIEFTSSSWSSEYAESKRRRKLWGLNSVSQTLKTWLKTTRGVQEWTEMAAKRLCSVYWWD